MPFCTWVSHAVATPRAVVQLVPIAWRRVTKRPATEPHDACEGAFGGDSVVGGAVEDGAVEAGAATVCVTVSVDGPPQPASGARATRRSTGMCLVTRATALKLAVAFLKICRNCGTFSRFAVSLALGQKPNLRQARRGTGDPMRPCRPPGRIAADSRGVAQLFQREPVSSPRRHAKEKGCCRAVD